MFSAARYGRGCYFAVRSRYSDRYSSGQTDVESKYMFLARVLTGDYCAGKEEMIVPPEKPGSGETPRKYDSVVDDAEDPDIFVVFKDSSVYPNFLITYT